MGQSALGFGMGTGLEGMGDYMNPMLAQYFQGMDPLYDRAYAQAGQTAGQQATMQGAFGGSRAGIMEGQMRGDVQRAQMADYGSRQYQAAQQAAQLLMGERARMGQMGMGMSQLGLGGQMGALGGMGGTNRDLMLGGDYLRNIQQQGNEQEYRNALNAAQAITGTYGKDIKKVTEDRQEGSVLGDLMGIGGMVGGTLLGGVPGIGAALGGLFGGGSGGGGTPYMNQLQSDPWSGMSLGGQFSSGLGGGGGGSGPWFGGGGF
jgi:hypothetical protein